MRLRGVGRRYGLAGPWVLRGVDLDVRPGSLTRVEGTNGSGKSTLLRLLAGIDAPTSGRITDRPRTAYVPERFPAELPFSVLGYLTHLGRIHGLGRAEAARGAGEWLERFGADAYAATPLAELSKGTSQKVAVAQALLAAPALLVLDEAWTGLDRAARAVLDEAVAERVAEGAAVVFVDHDPRRLPGAPDAVFRVTDTRLEPLPLPAAGGETPVAAPGPRVRIEAEAPPGTALPPNLPGAPRYEPVPEPTTPTSNPGGEAARVGQATQGALGPGGEGLDAGHGQAAQTAPGPGDEARAGARPGQAGRNAGEGVPGGPPQSVPEGGRRVVRMVVSAGESDEVLRVLLGADPAWRIRSVSEVAEDV
ncbi:ATP-binding cassette domain-containing protein [Streptomyces sp. NPDC059850]|uniref:ABC transporter ATP-binding protein n=1 Tax=Streptomyces sp. NPDC059850 TaxID=3346970 RepID=UPI0036525870